MKLFSRILIVLFVLLLTRNSFTQSKPAPGWSEPKYFGMVFGQTTKRDILQIFGKPKYDGPEADTHTPILVFHVLKPISGNLTFYLEKGFLSSMYLDPDKDLNEREIIHLFGNDYKVVRYETDSCIDYGGYGPVYQDPNGRFKTFEYRHLGIIVNFGNYDKTYILYADKPYGPEHSQCPAPKKPAKKK